MVLHKTDGQPVRTEHVLPKLLVKKSSIPGAGRGIFADEDIDPERPVSKYGGDKIAVCDADARRQQVIS